MAAFETVRGDINIHNKKNILYKNQIMWTMLQNKYIAYPDFNKEQCDLRQRPSDRSLQNVWRLT